MIKKEVKQYKQGNSYSYRINIAKQDKLTGHVWVLSNNEYETVTNENKELKKEIDNYKKKLENKENDIINLKNQIKKIEKEKEQDIKKYDELVTYVLESEKELKIELDKQHHEQIKNNQDEYIKKYDEYNKEIQKYNDLNKAYSIAFNNILNLSLFDLLKNKHKKIANDNIKKLDTKKIVYELTEKKD